MWTPFWIAAAGLAMNILLGQALLSTLAHGAIALSNSAGACLQVVFLLLVAHRRLGGIEGRQLGHRCCGRG
jgi:peptidoglycan biosynthesis protein MviN/MurJ (putative lipid II flippase)